MIVPTSVQNVQALKVRSVVSATLDTILREQHASLSVLSLIGTINKIGPVLYCVQQVLTPTIKEDNAKLLVIKLSTPLT